MSEVILCVPTHSTAFFREKHHFQFLAETVVSDLKAGATLGRIQQVRIWSAACFTGEEPYSIAISLLESLRDAPSSAPATYQPGGWHIEVVASDVDPIALAAAGEGIYSEDSLDEVPSAIKKRYFFRGRGDMSGRVRVRQGLANLVRFQCLNLEDEHWPVEGLFDVIFFRNVLHSYQRATQELCLRKMLQYLNPHGYLILGHSDHVPWLRDAVASAGNSIHQLRPRGTERYTGKERRTSTREQGTLE